MLSFVLVRLKLAVPALSTFTVSEIDTDPDMRVLVMIR
jgi:hypothetical protein